MCVDIACQKIKALSLSLSLVVDVRSRLSLSFSLEKERDLFGGLVCVCENRAICT